MGRLLRSTTSNPAGAALDAFVNVYGLLDQAETNKQRRTLMAQEEADRRLTRERAQNEEKFKEEERTRTREKWADEKLLGDLMGAEQEMDLARKEGREPKYTPTQQDALFKTLGQNNVFDPERVDEQTDAIRKVQGFMRDNGQQLMKGGRLDRDKYPDLFDSFDKIFDKQINRGGDRYGNTVEANGVIKKVKSVFIDPKDQSLAFSLEVKTPVKEGQVFKHIGDGAPTYTVNPKAPGMSEQGNIDLSTRPVVRNGDGSISTVKSMSIEEDGKEILIPLISDSGKTMSRDEAIKEYRKTGKHLGKFESIEAATSYAEQLHADPMWNKDIEAYSAKGRTETSYEAPMTFDRAADPNAEVIKLPIGILDQYLFQHERLGSKIQQIRAKLDPKAYAEKIEKIKKTKAENAAVNKAMQKVDTSKPAAEQRATFIKEFTGLMPDAPIKDVTDLAKTLIGEKEKRQYATPEETAESNRKINSEIRSALGAVNSDATLKTNEARRVKFGQLMGNSTMAPKDVAEVAEKNFPKAEEKEGGYKQRTRKVDSKDGSQTVEIFEESKDGGKTWTEVSKSTSKKGGEASKRSLTTDDEGTQRVVDLESGKSKPVIDEATGKPVKGKKQLSIADENRRDRQLKEGDKILLDKHRNLADEFERKDIKGIDGLISHLEDKRAALEAELSEAGKDKKKKTDPNEVNKGIGKLDVQIRELRAKQGIMEKLISEDGYSAREAEREAEKIVKEVKKKKGIKD